MNRALNASIRLHFALFMGAGLIWMFAASAPLSFSQVQTTQNRIPQDVVINGQMVHGAYVTAPGGQMQSFTCPTPQRYNTADNAVQGWACYESTTGVWLLNALPPAQDPVAPVPVPVPQQPAVIDQQAPPPVIYQQPAPTIIYPQPAPTVIYQQPAPTVIYQQPAPTVIYQQPAPTVIYQQPVVVHSIPRRPIVVAPVYPSSVVLGTAAINAASRIASAAIIASQRHGEYYPGRKSGRGRRW